MFSGVGGFELGLGANNLKSLSEIQQDRERGNRTSKEQGTLFFTGQKSTFRCIGCSEIDKYASELLNKKFPSVKNWGDCTKIDPNELPDFDMLCGGFPCQAFSIAGKRRGFEDTRGTMFFEVARILKIKRPKLILLENVKGLLNHNKGETFKVIIQTLEELGYRTQWMVLNSKFFGVPQNRERVFIIGSLRGEPRPEILPFRETEQQFNSEGVVHPTLTEAIGRQGSSKEYIKSIEVIGNLNSETWRKRNESIRRVYGTEGISPTIPTGTGGGVMTKVAIGYDTNDSRPEIGQANRVYGEKGVICPLNNWSPKIKEQMKIRRLTPTECERLQGFPQYESYINLQIQDNICQLDLQKSYVNVESQNLKLLSVAGNVEKEDINKNVSSVERNLKQEINKPVQENVLINCEEEKIVINNQEKSLEFVNYVESQDSFLQHIKKEDFAQMIVGINSICEKIINLGKEELLQNEESLIQVKNGKIFVKLFGNEMMQPAKDVKKDLITLRGHLKYITSNHLNIKNSDSKWRISFSYVISAIIGCIQKETKINNSLKLKIKSRFGYTFGFSDTQRYKMMGNAVTVNVIKAIAEKLI